jgi:hypothetical protein
MELRVEIGMSWKKESIMMCRLFMSHRNKGIVRLALGLIVMLVLEQGRNQAATVRRQRKGPELDKTAFLRVTLFHPSLQKWLICQYHGIPLGRSL